MSQVGKQYAEALFELAQERDQSDKVARELRRLAELSENADLRQTLRHPGLPAEERVGVVRKLLGDDSSDLTMNLVLLLVQKGREGLLPGIAAEFMSLVDADRGLIHAEVYTPVDPGAEALQELEAELRSRWGRPVRISIHIDPELLGGMAIKVGDLWVDGSLSAQIERLRRSLAGY